MVWWLVALVLVFTCAQGVAPACDGGEFVVVVDTTEPLGMRLSEKLVVLSFAADASGRPRAVEASDLVHIGDTLAGVNGRATDGAALLKVVEWIRDAELPKKLTFRAHDRCVPTDEAEATAVTAIDDVSINFVTVATPTWKQKFFAVLSEFGAAPACDKFSLVLADPIHACEPLANSVAGRYVVVKSSRQCSPHQQALLVGEAGGLGVVLAQYEGKALEPIAAPPRAAIHTPVVLVSMESAVAIVEMVLGTSPTAAPPSIHLVLTARCEQLYLDPSVDAATVDEKRVLLADAHAGDMLVMASAATAAIPPTVEFIKARQSPALDVATHQVVVVSGNLCQGASVGNAAARKFVLAKITSTCDAPIQINRLVASGAAGLLLAVSSPESTVLPSVAIHSIGGLVLAIPAVFVSVATFDFMSVQAADGDVSIAFEPNNAYLHHHDALATVHHPANWPASEDGRHVLYHRMRKVLGESEPKLDVLERAYARATAHYRPSEDVLDEAHVV
ncbi:Aste57867_22918 [Aphanomyces stellatus]|uniref:Aste57867_22918 protein n=1 Tax=Aphanomyces stellatus TaxID=120398 RepID=A0A485LMX6_9STRA|nr:hypothetical protein As57867_022847 [Aphanomyces stellatus]VFT99568.1 Aste57867_22918 [Aphanomyces stellatus]